ncbi:uncharacterized protein BDR25DRAFT_342474 [Lindgomyces ingoldianus]|uniref:Uncharacterized protein n=1 Tax=Lindgomyces ingoldianus TaxID=673940 RepID=A0ACB6QYL0_9PLEO|nr:uncharacterized protein BDR25DRAFT_342474 [Lindgomyces ingoldianus]KAF2471872.1 hypothetical protein BDR25DRAFT_342474 [Lindgomyces ingoldianus]
MASALKSRPVARLTGFRYLSATATLLFISYQIHNVVSWLKIRPFLPKWGSRFFILSLVAVQPFWIAEAWSNFEYFNGLGNNVNEKMRPWEALVRDPWWIFTTWKLIDSIKETYGFKLWNLVRINSRFGVMLLCMFLSIAFLTTDIFVTALRVTKDSGINPYWRMALVFKCASDTIFLDDFKSVLDDIVTKSFSSQGGTIHRGSHAIRRRSTHPEGPDFIECGPIAKITSPQPAAHSRSLTPLTTRGNNRVIPKIHVQRETTVTTELRNPSQESFGSNHKILLEPEPTIYVPSYDNSNFTTQSSSHMNSGA